MNSKRKPLHGIRLLLLLLCVFSLSGVKAQTNIVSLSGPATVKPGSTFRLALCLNNQTTMVAYQAHVVFPEGFEPVENSETGAEWWASDRATAKHFLSGLWLPEKDEVALASFSYPLAEFDDTDGALCYINVHVGDNISDGQYVFSIRNFVLDTDGRTSVPVDTMTYTVNVTANVTGVEAIESESAVEGDSFNVIGQRVNDSYQGVIVKKGQKYLNNN